MNEKIASCFEKIWAYSTLMKPGITWYGLSRAMRKYRATTYCHFKKILSTLLAFTEIF